MAVVDTSIRLSQETRGSTSARSSFSTRLLKGDTRSVCYLFVAAILLVLPMDLPQLMLISVGAAAAVVLNVGGRPRDPPPSKHLAKHKLGSPTGSPSAKKGVMHGNVSTSVVKQADQKLVLAKTFTASTFEEQVHELLEELDPSSPHCLRVQWMLEARVRQIICDITPTAKVTVFVSGDIARHTSSAIAVPEVEVIVRLCPQVLFDSLKKSNNTQSLDTQAKQVVDEVKVQKFAVRRFTEHLVKSGIFKYRRSAFGGKEPKVTLVGLNIAGVDQVNFDFSVNYGIGIHNGGLVAEVSNIDSRAKDLILLVRRWAKDRSICHATKGSLAPYAWTMMVIYFLQIGTAVPILPLLECQKHGQEVAIRKCDFSAHQKSLVSDKPSKSVAELLREFFRFYAKDMNWDSEVVCISGQRSQPEPAWFLTLTGDTSRVNIEDPFQPECNIGATVTQNGWFRLQQELSRAVNITSDSDSDSAIEPRLAELLMPWVPESADE